MSEEKFYRCIPELNKECKKNNCYINGGYCEMTICKEYSLKGLLEEIERLNNIIDELEKELREDYKIWMCDSRSNGKSVKFGIDVCKIHFYNRLQELKGSDENDD